MARALIVVRLSRVTDATTSPERQLETCRELCALRGYDVVGVAEDLDVSAGATSPFERPQLGDWLNNRVDEFDVLMVYRMDRIVRRLLDLADVIRWCQAHSVALVSATESFLDLTAPFGDIIALLVAKVAEMELQAISERNRSAAQYNLRAGKYRGGVPPWGYVPSNKTGEWRLIQDPEQVKIIGEVVQRVLDSEPLRAVARDLTERAVPTPRDRFAKHQGREVKGYEWHSGPLKRALTNQALLGYAMSGEAPIRNDDGSPVVRSDPVLTREVFDRVGAELADRENRKEPTKRSTGLLLRVIYCGVCGRPSYRLKGHNGRVDRYRCASVPDKASCGNRYIPSDVADKGVEGAVLGLLGESERLERVWDSGSDHSAELAEINDRLIDLTGLLGAGPYRAGTPQRVALDAQIESLAARQAALSAEAVKPAGWTWQPTGEKFGDWWARQDITGKNIWLRSMNIRVEFDREQIRLDLGDLETMTQGLRPGRSAAAWVEFFQMMTEDGMAGVEIDGDEVTFHARDGRTLKAQLGDSVLTEEQEAQAAEFYGWNRDSD